MFIQFQIFIIINNSLAWKFIWVFLIKIYALFFWNIQARVFLLLIHELFFILSIQLKHKFWIISFGTEFHYSNKNCFSWSIFFGSLRLTLGLIIPQIFSIGNARSRELGGFWIQPDLLNSLFKRKILALLVWQEAPSCFNTIFNFHSFE